MRVRDNTMGDVLRKDRRIVNMGDYTETQRKNERTNERKKHNNTNVKQVSKRVDSIIFKSYDLDGAVVIIVYWADIKLYPLGDWLPKIYKIRATTVSSLLKSTPF